MKTGWGAAPRILRSQFSAILHALSSALAVSADNSTTDYQLVGRTQDSATYQRVVSVTNDVGEVALRTNLLTVLDHGMYYLQNGEYTESQDLVESFPDGAIARYGVYQTIFSPDLHALAVFDIQGFDAKRIRGGVRTIQLTDIASGKSVVLGTVKDSVPAEIIPPNQVVYRSAFDGLDADVLYVWKHNAFSQNIIIKASLAEFPAGLDQATTRLEIVTELVESPEVKLTTQVLKQDGKPDLVDDGTISFGQMLAVPGTAFPVGAGGGLNLTGPNSSGDKALPVLKQWQKLDDGRVFVIESVSWQQAEPLLKDLGARADNSANAGKQVAQARVWPEPVVAAEVCEPIQVASVPYLPEGYLVDLELLSGSALSKTFNATTTYYIPATYNVTSGSTFEGGTVIKLGPGATLSLSGSLASPVVGVATLTSRDDDTTGERVTNAGNPPYTSDGVVSTSDWANAPLSIYNGSCCITVQRFRVRYANHAVNDYSPYYTHNVQYCRLESSSVGVFAYYTTVNMVNNEVCNVATNGFASTGAAISESGTVTDCGLAYRTQSFLGVTFGETFDGENYSGVPDTMGAIGPNHFAELINGAMVIFDRTTGARLAQSGIDHFFRLTNGGTIYPRGYMSDPRIVYDHRKGRWFASAMENSSISGNQVILAVSRGSDPLGDPSSDWKSLKWDRFLIDVAIPDGHADFPTLGTDDNGVYIGIHGFPGPTALVAIQKSPLLAVPPTLNATSLWGLAYSFLQPAVNFDAVPPSGPAWIVAHRQGYQQDIVYATILWNAGVPSLSAWAVVPTPAFGAVPPTPTKWGQQSLITDGTILTSTSIRNSQLWTCRTIGVNSSGGATNPDRKACEWIHLTLSGTSATNADSGRVFDSASSNPRFYFVPSIMVNSVGDVLMAFSGSGNNDYIGAFCVGRSSSDLPGQMSAVKTLKAGEAAYLGNRWGDYSHTTLDPNNSLAIWTIQEYARTPSSTWQTWVGEITIIKP